MAGSCGVCSVGATRTCGRVPPLPVPRQRPEWELSLRRTSPWAPRWRPPSAGGRWGDGGLPSGAAARARAFLTRPR
eukprot:11050263-Alexandrium_andersonii.AAC.1